MSSAAIIQIAAEGPQELVMRGTRPDYTLWKSMVTKYTNFSSDWQEVELSSGVQYDGKASATLTRYGDLIDAILVEFTLPALTDAALEDASSIAYSVQGGYYVNAIGYALLKEVELQIGGATVQKQTTENLFTYEELFNPAGRRLRDVIGRFDYADDIETEMIDWSSVEQKIYVPLPFYNYIYGEKSLAIPMVALQKHDIVVKLSFNSLADCVVHVYKPNPSDATTDPYYYNSTLPLLASTSATITKTDLSARLLVSYVYISEMERQIFSNNELQYIIVQDQNTSQSVSASATQTQFQLNFSHPIGWIDWRQRPTVWNSLTTNSLNATAGARRRYSVGYKDRFDYSMYSADASLTWGGIKDFFTTAELKFNSHNRLPQDVSARFFREFMSYQCARSSFTGYEYLWAFAINVTEFNPTSTCNFSKIDNITIKFTHPASLPACDIYVHANNYNQAIVVEGMYGVRFSS